MRRCPWNLLLKLSMGWALDLLRSVKQEHAHPEDGEVSPAPRLGTVAHNPAAPLTPRTTAAVLVGLHEQVQFLAPVLELKSIDFHLLQTQDLAQQLHVAHGSLPLCC